MDLNFIEYRSIHRFTQQLYIQYNDNITKDRYIDSCKYKESQIFEKFFLPAPTIHTLKEEFDDDEVDTSAEEQIDNLVVEYSRLFLIISI